MILHIGNSNLVEPTCETTIKRLFFRDMEIHHVFFVVTIQKFPTGSLCEVLYQPQVVVGQDLWGFLIFFFKIVIVDDVIPRLQFILPVIPGNFYRISISLLSTPEIALI